jgi:hypothetical protein
MTHHFKASLLLAAALLIPACGNGDKEDPAPAGAAAGNVLFSEEFDTVFPGTRWTPAFKTGSGTSAVVDGTAGSPGPSLALTTTDGPSFISTDTTMTFASLPMTVSVQIAASSADEGTGGVAILDSTGASIAAAEWHAAAPGAITLRILGTTLGVTPPTPGAGFHTFTLAVTASGEASWSIDGAAIPAMTQSGFPSDMIRVQLYDLIASPAAASFATYRFDNVTVTSP